MGKSSSTQWKQQTFDFLGLPAELRNMVYKLYFSNIGMPSDNDLPVVDPRKPTQMWPVHVPERGPFRRVSDFLSSVPESPHELAAKEIIQGVSGLLVVNKQIRREALGVYYESAIFLISTSPKRLGKWLTGLGAHRTAALKHMRFEVNLNNSTSRAKIDETNTRWKVQVTFELALHLSGRNIVQSVRLMRGEDKTDSVPWMQHPCKFYFLEESAKFCEEMYRYVLEIYIREYIKQEVVKEVEFGRWEQADLVRIVTAASRMVTKVFVSKNREASWEVIA